MLQAPALGVGAAPAVAMMASVLVNGSTLEMTVSDSSQIPTAAHLAAAHPELVARGSADSAVAHARRPQLPPALPPQSSGV